jgi:hypothetical protein
MVDKARPRKPAIQPFTTRSGLCSVPAIMMPKKASRKNSKEVNWSANSMMTGDRMTSAIMPTIVPINEAVVVSPRARPPSPCSASGYPSMAEAADAAVPGMLSRMAEYDPP